MDRRAVGLGRWEDSFERNVIWLVCCRGGLLDI